MSTEAMRWANQVVRSQQNKPKAKRLKGHEIAILRQLAFRHNQVNGQCDPSIATLMVEVGASRSTVRRALKALEAAGLIKVHERRSGKISSSNSYSLRGRAVVLKGPGSKGFEPGVCETLDPGSVWTPKKRYIPLTKRGDVMVVDDSEGTDLHDAPEPGLRRPLPEGPIQGWGLTDHGDEVEFDLPDDDEADG